MLTSSIPSVTRALSGSLPPGAVRQLTQAIGNCSQPLTSRGGMNFQTPAARTLGAQGPGAMGGGTWNPQDYIDLLPPTDQAGNVVLPGYDNPWAWNVTNYGGDNFYFPTSQEFTTNQYYGGPTFNVAGDTVFENAYTTNMNVTNLTTDTINGQPAPGRPGDTGPSGAPGRVGAAGLAGQNGAGGEDGVDGFGFNGLNGAPGAPGARGRDAINQRYRFIPKPGRIVRYVSEAWFDPETCLVKTHKKTLRYIVGGFIVPDVGQ